MFKVKSSVQLATRKEVKKSLRIIINDLLNLKYIISILTKFEKKNSSRPHHFIIVLKNEMKN